MEVEESKSMSSRSAWATTARPFKRTEEKKRRGGKERGGKTCGGDRMEERKGGTEREEKEGEGRGEKKKKERETLFFRKAGPWQVCLGADYSNSPKQIIFF